MDQIDGTGQLKKSKTKTYSCHKPSKIWQTAYAYMKKTLKLGILQPSMDTLNSTSCSLSQEMKLRTYTQSTQEQSLIYMKRTNLETYRTIQTQP
jgi:hypothetical protein